MKGYVITTGSLFGLLTLAHIWRMVQEPHLVRDPWFLVFTALATGLCVWACRLLMTTKRSPGDVG
jgi:uncharacterized membrane protein